MASVNSMQSMRPKTLSHAHVATRARARALSSRVLSGASALQRPAVSRATSVRKPMAVKARGPDFAIFNDFDQKYKEDARKYRRNVYGADDWVGHRSGKRYLKSVSTLVTSSNIRGQIVPLTIVGLISTVVVLINELTELSLIMSMTPFTVTASSLSLLLVFRTNASYDRWWEARKIWGALLNRSRDFVRQGLTWFDEKDMELKKQHTRYMIAFAVALKAHLRPSEEDMRAELAPILKEQELELALSKAHVPNHLLRMMSAIVAKSEISNFYKARMDDNITAFEDDLGKCERIFKTPIPLAYTRMTSRFLLIWLSFVPMALYPSTGWASVPATLFIAVLFLAIEEVGVSIEEPFSIISCEGICGSVKDNCTAMFETHLDDAKIVASGSRMRKMEVVPVATAPSMAQEEPAVVVADPEPEPLATPVVEKIPVLVASPTPYSAASEDPWWKLE